MFRITFTISTPAPHQRLSIPSLQQPWRALRSMYSIFTQIAQLQYAVSKSGISLTNSGNKPICSLFCSIYEHAPSSSREKKYAHYMGLASWAGARIIQGTVLSCALNSPALIVRARTMDISRQVSIRSLDLDVQHRSGCPDGLGNFESRIGTVS